VPEGFLARVHGRLDLRRWRVFAAAWVRQGWRRVTGSCWPVLVAAAGASIAWFVAHALGRDYPLFAPIAAWICLGFKADRVPRKVAELGVGATAGVLIGEVVARAAGAGWWQVGLVLVIAALVGRFLDRGDLTSIQAGVNAIVVVGMSWWQTHAGGVQARWLEALVGATVAFVIAVMLPRHPTGRPRRYARSTLTEFATSLEMLGRGLTTGDVELLADVRGQRRALTQVALGWEETLTTAREVVSFNPGLWRHRAEVAELDRLFRLTRRAQRSADMLSRQALGMTEEVGAMPLVGHQVAEAARATRVLAGAVGHWNRPVAARAILTDLAAELTPGELATSDWRPVALTAVVRSLVVDLLQLTGLSREQARDLLPDTWGRPFGVPEADEPRRPDEDEASTLWGGV